MYHNKVPLLYFFRIVRLFEEMAIELVQQDDFRDPITVEVDNLVFTAVKVIIITKNRSTHNVRDAKSGRANRQTDAENVKQS